ncbi:MAG: hypothetical protein R3A51_17130 [Nannocystaceae bacterium]|nr:hypothetical protein [Myxococcales bacterium]
MPTRADYRIKHVEPGTAIVWPTKTKPALTRTAEQQKLLRSLPAKLEPTSADQWISVLRTLPRDVAEMTLKSKFWTTGEEIVLSARTPVVEGRGHLLGWQVQSYVPTNPALYFDYGGGGLEIWLEHLDTAGAYMVDIHLGAQGTVMIGASDAPNYEMQGAGPDTHAYVYIQSPTYDLALVTMRGEKAEYLSFYEARVWRIS